MKNSVASVLALSIAGLAVPAAAQDATFTGPWVAGVAGVDILKAGSSVDDDINNDRDESVEGFMYGGAVGYDYDLGQIVVGAEAELTDSDADSDYDGVVETFGLGAVDAGRDIYVGARLGYKLRPQTLLYVKGGYSNARFNYVGSDGETINRVNLDTDGFRVGAGLEQRFGEHAFGRFEYRYSNYSEGELDYEADDRPDGGRFDVDTDRHQVVGTVGLRF